MTEGVHKTQKYEVNNIAKVNAISKMTDIDYFPNEFSISQM